jgi:hypothetical protein
MNKITVASHPPCSSDLAFPGLFLFPEHNMILMGNIFNEITMIHTKLWAESQTMHFMKCLE